MIAAPRREGMLLARELGWLTDASFLPHMKRIPLNDGLAVGIEYLPHNIHTSRSCHILDGVIASGATVITLMELFFNMVDHFNIYTVHCPGGAINALTSYAAILKKEISLYVGHISGTLDNNFYAVSAEDSKLIVGDVGDIISPLLNN
jgi:uracil phosphoribosyltransferase